MTLLTQNIELARKLKEGDYNLNTMKIYGHYASQPARSVLWLLKMHKKPFEFIKVEPLAGGTKKADFANKFPTRQIPTMDDEGFYLAESSAIMQYICEKYQLEQFWSLNPKHIQSRAKIAEYLSYHHQSTRKLSGLLAFPLFKQKFFKKQWDEQDKQTSIKTGKEILTSFEHIFLPTLNTNTTTATYIQGLPHPTIADLAAYSEIAQLEQLQIMTIDSKEYPKLSIWLNNMSKLPEHDDIFATVKKIGAM